MTTFATTAPATINYAGHTYTLPRPLHHTYTEGQKSLIDFVVGQGWTLDVTAIENAYGRLSTRLPEDRREYYVRQHPFAFTRPAADGGTWRLKLDYRTREYSNYYTGFNKTLKGAKLTHVAADGTKTRFPASLSAYATSTGNRENTEIVLQKQSTAGYASTNWIWEATRNADGGHTLRTQVERLASNPDLVVWIAAELQYADKVREDQAKARKAADAAERSKPLAPSWGVLRSAARDILNADGKSDAVALLAALKAAVAVVEDEVVVH